MADVSRKPAATPRKPRVVTTPRRPRAQRDRLSCRIDTRIKQRAEEAATLLGQDLTAFTESALNEKAQEVLEREERLLLSERDFALFTEALDNPQPASARLKAAAEDYKATCRQHPELNW